MPSRRRKRSSLWWISSVVARCSPIWEKRRDSLRRGQNFMQLRSSLRSTTCTILAMCTEIWNPKTSYLILMVTSRFRIMVCASSWNLARKPTLWQGHPTMSVQRLLWIRVRLSPQIGGLLEFWSMRWFMAPRLSITEIMRKCSMIFWIGSSSLMIQKLLGVQKLRISSRIFWRRTQRKDWDHAHRKTSESIHGSQM